MLPNSGRLKLAAALAAALLLSLVASVLAGHHLVALVAARAQALHDSGLAGLAFIAAAFFLAALAGFIPGALLGLAAGAWQVQRPPSGSAVPICAPSSPTF